MKNLYKQAKAFYLRNKISNFEYDCVRSEIYSTNRSILLICSFVTLVLFFILTILSLFFNHSTVFNESFCYAFFFVVVLTLFIVTLKLPEKYNRATVFLIYFFIWCFNLYTILTGVLCKPDNFAVTFFVFDFAWPLIFVDKIRRVFINSFIAVVLLIVLSIIVKEPEIYKVDVFNGMVIFGLSYLPGFYLTKIRVREFSLRQIIESERDTDELTGLLNKSAFIRQAKKNIGTNHNGILIIMDLDFFKQINDTYGHFTGDSVLKLTSSCIRQTFRSSDLMGRFGGDEFVVLMAKTDLMNIAELRCNQLLQLLNNTRIFPEDENDKTSIHASLGFALYNGENDFDSLFKKADKALYDAKNNGKDRVCKFN